MSSSIKTKNTLTAYLLWLPPLGWFGVHRYYLGDRWAAVRMGAITIVAPLLVVLLYSDTIPGPIGRALGIGLVPWGVAVLFANLLWWLADIYLTYDNVEKNNAKVLASSRDKSTTPQQMHDSGNKKSTKSTRTAHILWLPPLGWLGAHRLYAKRWSGLIFLAIFAFWAFQTGLFVSLAFSVGSLGGGIRLGGLWLLFNAVFVPPLAIWWIIDSLLIDDMIEDYNAKLLTNSHDSLPIS